MGRGGGGVGRGWKPTLGLRLPGERHPQRRSGRLSRSEAATAAATLVSVVRTRLGRGREPGLGLAGKGAAEARGPPGRRTWWSEATVAFLAGIATPCSPGRGREAASSRLSHELFLVPEPEVCASIAPSLRVSLLIYFFSRRVPSPFNHSHLYPPPPPNLYLQSYSSGRLPEPLSPKLFFRRPAIFLLQDPLRGPFLCSPYFCSPKAWMKPVLAPAHLDPSAATCHRGA